MIESRCGVSGVAVLGKILHFEVSRRPGIKLFRSTTLEFPQLMFPQLMLSDLAMIIVANKSRVSQNFAIRIQLIYKK